MLEYAHIALSGPRQCMNTPVLHSLAPESAISYPESAITIFEPRAIYYQREELLILLICRPGKQEGISKPVFNQGGALQVSFNVFQIASISSALLSKIIG